MLYTWCGHYYDNGEHNCPCTVRPDELYDACEKRCNRQSLPEGYEQGVDTSLLCDKARAYCESGRKEDGNV